jgi:hypothetical protein
MKTLFFEFGKLVSFADRLKGCTSFKFSYVAYAYLLEHGFIIPGKQHYIGKYTYCENPLICVHFVHISDNVSLSIDEIGESIIFHHKNGKELSMDVQCISNNTIVCP